MRKPSATASSAASRIARDACCASSPAWPRSAAAGEDHRHRVRDVLALEGGRRAVRRFGHHGRDLGGSSSANATSSDSAPAIEPNSGRTRSERMSPSRFSDGITSGSPRRRDEQRERRVDQLRLVRHVGMPLGRRVHLLLQHPLVDRADGVLRAAEDLRARPLGRLEGELGDAAADPPLDALRPERRLVVALALAPLLRAVGVADRHPHDRDRRVHAAERNDARESAGRCGRSRGRRSPRGGSGSATPRRRLPRA